MLRGQEQAQRDDEHRRDADPEPPVRQEILLDERRPRIGTMREGWLDPARTTDLRSRPEPKPHERGGDSSPVEEAPSPARRVLR
jgi:hypothetical protein